MVERISYRQFFFIVYLSEMTLIVTSLLSVTAYDQTRQDAWISALLTLFIAPLITYVLMSLGVLFPGQTFVEYVPRILGRFFGTIVSLLFLLFLLERTAFLARVFSGMLTTSIYTLTPNVVFIVLTSLIAALGVRYGIEVISRMADIFAPVFIFVTVLVVVVSIPLWNTNWVLPIMSRGITPVAIGAVTPTALCVEQVYLLMLMPLMDDARWARSVATWATFAVGVTKLVLVLTVLFTLGPFEAPRYALPVYEMTRLLTLGELYERLDPIPLLTWSMSMQMQLYVLFYAVTKGIGQLFGVKDFRSLSFPIAALGLCAATIVFADFSQYREVVDPSITGVFLLGLVFPIFLLIQIVARLRSTPQDGSADKEDR